MRQGRPKKKIDFEWYVLDQIRDCQTLMTKCQLKIKELPRFKFNATHEDSIENFQLEIKKLEWEAAFESWILANRTRTQLMNLINNWKREYDIKD